MTTTLPTVLSMNQGMLFTYTDPPIPTYINPRILCTERTLLATATGPLLMASGNPRILNVLPQQTDPPSHGKCESKDPKCPPTEN